MTLLEANLRDRLGKEAFVTASFTSLSSNRPLSLRNLLDRATANDLIPAVDRDMINKWTKLRNEAVHTAKPVSRADAKEVIEGVERLLAPF